MLWLAGWRGKAGCSSAACALPMLLLLGRDPFRIERAVAPWAPSRGRRTCASSTASFRQPDRARPAFPSSAGRRGRGASMGEWLRCLPAVALRRPPLPTIDPEARTASVHREKERPPGSLRCAARSSPVTPRKPRDRRDRRDRRARAADIISSALSYAAICSPRPCSPGRRGAGSAFYPPRPRERGSLARHVPPAARSDFEMSGPGHRSQRSGRTALSLCPPDGGIEPSLFALGGIDGLRRRFEHERPGGERSHWPCRSRRTAR